MPVKNIRIVITIDAQVDGTMPTNDEIHRAASGSVAGVWLSEDYGKPDEWAVVVQLVETKIKKVMP